MAERIVQEESLVAVADAIRAKGGTTDALSFPTGFADAISAIQAGGGGGDIEGLKINSGSFTPDSNITTSYEIITNPDNPTGTTIKRVLFLLFRKTETSAAGIAFAGIHNFTGASSSYAKFGGRISGTGTYFPMDTSEFGISTGSSGCGNTVTITCSTTRFLSAHEYVWFELLRP